MSRRAYDNTGRVEQARLTRQRIVAAARDLIVERGPSAVTVRDIAARARVSTETVYKAFGTKHAVIKSVYDVTLAGDDAPVRLADRPEIRAIAAARDPREKLTRYAALARSIGERLGPLLAKLRAAADGGDRDLLQLMSTVDEERLAGTAALAGHLADAGCLRPDVDRERARDTLWALISPELLTLLVSRRGWSYDDYEHWLADTMCHALLRPRGSRSR